MEITGLSAGTKYFVRAYATNTQGTTYGEQKEFTTNVVAPTVTTLSPINVNQTTATGKGEVTDIMELSVIVYDDGYTTLAFKVN